MRPFPAVPLLLAITAAAGAQPTSPLAEGERLFAARDWDGARAQFTAAVRADSRSAVADAYLGRLALLAGNGEDAAHWLEKATELDPGNARYLTWLGDAYGRAALRASRFRQFFLAPKVRDAFARAVRLDPADVDARVGLLEYYLVAPGIMGGSVDRAREQAAAIARTSAFRGHLAAAAVAERTHDDVAAEREYRMAVAAAPDSAAGYGALSDYFRRSKRWPDAWDALDQLRERRPDDPALLYWTGRLAAVSGTQLPRGEAALRRYLAIRPGETDPPLASAHFRLGAVYEQEGRRDDARREYEATLALDPQQSDAKDALGRLK